MYSSQKPSEGKNCCKKSSKLSKLVNLLSSSWLFIQSSNICSRASSLMALSISSNTSPISSHSFLRPLLSLWLHPRPALIMRPLNSPSSFLLQLSPTCLFLHSHEFGSTQSQFSIRLSHETLEPSQFDSYLQSHHPSHSFATSSLLYKLLVSLQKSNSELKQTWRVFAST